ncbi:MAG: hypothetical protein KDM63_01955, partial [Verrucomicrobiae bacterium]|nr:hypothetical protein [Verrucomicrobiae bacterium]
RGITIKAKAVTLRYTHRAICLSAPAIKCSAGGSDPFGARGIPMRQGLISDETLFDRKSSPVWPRLP